MGRHRAGARHGAASRGIDAMRVLVALPTEIDAPNSRADRSWQLAIGLLASWRSTGGDRPALGARLAGVAAEGGEIMVEQVAVSLATVVEACSQMPPEAAGCVMPRDICGMAGRRYDVAA